jgi:hypothetical protein
MAAARVVALSVVAWVAFGKQSEISRKRATYAINEFKAVRALFACEPGVFYAGPSPLTVALPALHDGVRDCELACARTHRCRVLSHVPANGTAGARCVLARSRERVVAAASDRAVACALRAPPFLGPEGEAARSPLIAASKRVLAFPVGRAVRFFSLVVDAAGRPRLFARDGRFPNAAPEEGVVGWPAGVPDDRDRGGDFAVALEYATPPPETEWERARPGHNFALLVVDGAVHVYGGRADKADSGVHHFEAASVAAFAASGATGGTRGATRTCPTSLQHILDTTVFRGFEKLSETPVCRRWVCEKFQPM